MVGVDTFSPRRRRRMMNRKERRAAEAAARKGKKTASDERYSRLAAEYYELMSGVDSREEREKLLEQFVKDNLMSHRDAQDFGAFLAKKGKEVADGIYDKVYDIVKTRAIEEGVVSDPLTPSDERTIHEAVAQFHRNKLRNVKKHYLSKFSFFERGKVGKIFDSIT